MGSIRADIARLTATIRGTVDHLAGASRAVLHPVPNAREDGDATNTEVLYHLARRNPALLSLEGADIDQRVRAVARNAWNPVLQGLNALAVLVGPEVGKALAARLRSGDYVTNTDETAMRKNHRPAGVDTDQLAKALDAATATPEG